MDAMKRTSRLKPLNSQTACEKMKSPFSSVTRASGIKQTDVRKSIRARLNRNIYPLKYASKVC